MSSSYATTTVKKASGVDLAASDGPTGGTLGSRGSAPGGRASGLWFWVAGAFLLVAMAWAAMFIASRHANTEEVPLARPVPRR